MEPAELKKMNNVLADAIKDEAKEVCSSVSASLSVMKVAVHLMFFFIPLISFSFCSYTMKSQIHLPLWEVCVATPFFATNTQ